MFRAKSLELLARICRPQLRDRSVDQMDGARAPLLQEHNDTEPADDPDDSIDPTIQARGFRSPCRRSGSAFAVDCLVSCPDPGRLF